MRHFIALFMNERLRVLSDRTTMDLYRMFRMYCPNKGSIEMTHFTASFSKMDFFTWSELRQLVVFRSDILCTDASQSVFSKGSYIHPIPPIYKGMCEYIILHLQLSLLRWTLNVRFKIVQQLVLRVLSAYTSYFGTEMRQSHSPVNLVQ